MKNNYLDYCGYINFIGRTNVGKSSILNKILEKKISIVSKKSGTTQKNILGIQTIKHHQLIYIDTPGIKNIQDVLIIKKSISKVKQYITLIIFIIEKTIWSEIEEILLQEIKKISIPTILLINKIDLIYDKKKLLPFMKKINKQYNFLEIIPISAKTGKNINVLINILKNNIPHQQHIFKKGNITNLSKKDIISEIIREKFFIYLNQELPYLIKIKINKYFFDIHKIFNVNATIYIKNIRQKKIIIGNNGNKIKKCIFLSEKDISSFFNYKKTILKLIIAIK